MSHKRAAVPAMACGPVLLDSNTATVRLADVLHAECRPCSNASMPSDMHTTSWRKLMLSCNPGADILQKLFKASGRVGQILYISRVNSGGIPQMRSNLFLKFGHPHMTTIVP